MIGSAVTKFLDAQDQRHRHNWLVVTTESRFRYYFIKFPQSGGSRPVRLIREDLETDDIEDVTDGYRDVTADDLDFWYNAQRDMNDW